VSFNFPLVVTPAGAQPQDPATILAQLLAYVAGVEPGYTANLPGSLIEDISSTDVGAIVLIDRARVELINSLTPAGANAFLLNELGQIYGIVLGQPTNTSVNVVFTGTVGFVISPGFQVSDGTHVYQLVDGGIILSGGSSNPLTAVAVQSGGFAVPAHSVQTIVTSVPGGVTLAVDNPVAGTPATTSETEQSYRGRVLQAGLAASQGMPTYIKTLIQNVVGVVPRLVGVQVVTGTGIRVIVGGGDVLDVANAIFRSVFDPSHLLGAASAGTTVNASIDNFPDSYTITFVEPAAQVVTLDLTWNTNLANFTQGLAVNQAAVQALANYINNLPVGAPINTLELNNAFEVSVSSIIDVANITKMVWVVTINSIVITPTNEIYPIDPEGYATIANTDIAIVQG